MSWERGRLRPIGSPWKLLFLAESIVITQLFCCGSGVLWPGPVQAAADDGKAEYVDARVCAACHRQVDQDYRQTGLGRSFFRPTTANTIVDYTQNNAYYQALSDSHYRMIRRDGQYFPRRSHIGVA